MHTLRVVRMSGIVKLAKDIPNLKDHFGVEWQAPIRHKFSEMTKVMSLGFLAKAKREDLCNAYADCGSVVAVQRMEELIG